MLWDTENWQLQKTILLPDGPSDCNLAFLNNSEILVISGSEAFCVYFIDINSAGITATFKSFNQGDDWIIYTPDGYFYGSNNISQYVRFCEYGTNNLHPYEEYESTYKNKDVIYERLWGND